MSDVRLDDDAVVIEGDLRVGTGTITSTEITASTLSGERARFSVEVSATKVTAKALTVHGALRATDQVTGELVASLPVRAHAIALDHPSAPRLKKNPPITEFRAGGTTAAARRPTEEEPPGPRPEPMTPIPPRLALFHDFGAGTDRLVINRSRRYVQGVHLEGELVVEGAISQASSITLKDDVQALSADDAVGALDELRPVTFHYRDDVRQARHAGFIAEEAPSLVTDPGRDRVRPMDVVALLTSVVQQQQHAINQLTADLAALRAAIVNT